MKRTESQALKREHVSRFIYIQLRDIADHADTYTERSIQFAGRLIGTQIFELPSTYTGYASEQALIQAYRYGPTAWCEDHIFPRQVAGEMLVRQAIERRTVDPDDVASMLHQFTQVNRVTSDENQWLIQYQRRDVFTTWQEAYKKAGIVVLEWEKGGRTDDIRYTYPRLFPENRLKRVA